MERFKELLEKRWRDPRDDDLKEIDTIPDASFVSPV